MSQILCILLLLTGCAHPAQRTVPYKVEPQVVRRTSPSYHPPLRDYLIVIDPGHGGEDFGTHSRSKPTYSEKTLNLATSNLVREYLRQLGYRTTMTRTNDVFIPLQTRAAMANQQNPTMFVSIHYNSAPSPDAQGIEIYYYKAEDDKKRTQASQNLAKLILGKVLENTNAKSRGVKHGNFAVIRETNMPAVLIEGGFLTNDEEMQKIKDPAYIKQLAWGIAQGIDQYLRN